MPLVTSQGFQLTPDISGQLARGVQFGQQLSQNQLIQEHLRQEIDQRSQLAKTQQQSRQLSGDILSRGANQDQKIAELFYINPDLAVKTQQQLGITKQSQMDEAAAFSFDLENTPFGQRAGKIQARAQSLLSQGRDPKHTIELLGMPENAQNEALKVVQMAALPNDKRLNIAKGATPSIKAGVDAEGAGFFAVTPTGAQRIPGAAPAPSSSNGGKIGTFNPRDYTVESFAKFARSGDPADLKRFTEKTLDVGGVPHKLDPVTNSYVPIKTTKQVAKSRSIIEASIIEAKAVATRRGEVLTDLGQAKAALPGLNNAIGKLRDLAPIATHTLGGKLFDLAAKELGYGGTKGATAQAKFISIINNQVLPLLKPTFGGSFSVQEGESLKATMGDPDATPQEKLAQLDAFIDQKMRDIEAKQIEIASSSTDGATDNQEVIKFNKQGQRVN